MTHELTANSGLAPPMDVMPGQSRAVQTAMRMLNEDPWSISYVECHCTGTRIGDGIEADLNSFQQI